MRKSRRTKNVNGIPVLSGSWPEEKANQKRNPLKKNARNIMRKQRPQA